MEDKNDSSEFRFSVDDDEIPNLHFHTKRKTKQAEENKNIKVILLPVLLFLLVVAVLFPVYISIKKQIENIHNSGSTEAMKISADMEAKIASLSSRYEELEKSLKEKVFPVTETFSSFEQSIASIKEGLKKAEQNVEKISTSQTDKKELDTLAAQVEKNLAPVRENLRSVESAIKSVDEKFTKEAAELSSSFKETKERVNKIQNIISEPSPTGGIDRDTLETALENQQKTYQKRLDLLIENLAVKDDKIKSLQTKMEELEKRLRSLADKPVSSRSPASRTESSKSAKKAERDEDAAVVVRPVDQISKPASKTESAKKAERDKDADVVVSPIDQISKPASKAESSAKKAESDDKDAAVVVHPIDQISKSPESKAESAKKAESDDEDAAVVVHPIDQISKSPESKAESSSKKAESDEDAAAVVVDHPIDQIKPKPGTFIEQDIQ